MKVYIMKALSFFLIFFSLIFFTACDGPSLGGKVKKEYFTGGKLRSEFIMTDSTGRNGQLKKYGYEGHLTSVVNIKNGVKNSTEVWYDKEGRVILKVPYNNGEKEGMEYAFYPNGEVMIATTYQSNVRHGKAAAYKQDGTVQRQVMFKNGRLIN